MVVSGDKLDHILVLATYIYDMADKFADQINLTMVLQ